jgi:hypothetical protein
LDCSAASSALLPARRPPSSTPTASIGRP